MTKIKIFTGTSIEDIQESVNDFMEDKDVIDIIHAIDGSGGNDEEKSKKETTHYFTVVYNERRTKR